MAASSVPRGRSGAWSDRLAERIDNGPFPAAVVYGILALVCFGAVELAAWADGAIPVGEIEPIHLVASAAIPGYLWLIGGFNRAAARAMAPGRTLFALPDEAISSLTANMVMAPPWWTAGLALAWLLVATARILLDVSAVADLRLGTHGWPLLVTLAWLFMFTAAGSAFVVKIVHLAGAVRAVSGQQLRVSLWELGPLHGFSLLTARMAASLVLVMVALYGVRNDLLDDPAGLVAGVGGMALAAAVFVVPLLGIHERLVAEKARVRGDAARTMEAAVADLHAALRSDDLAAMDAHYKAIAAIEIEMRTLAAIPTWPWMTDTFRWIVGALMFPIVLFLIQFVITKVLAA
jgi:hypothetical protein